MLKEIITALQAYVQTHRFIIKHKLWKWILIPGIIYALLFCVGIYFFWQTSTSAISFMLLKTGIKDWMESLHNSWLNWLFIFGQIMLQLVFLLFYFSLFKYIFLIIGSPVFAYLSEKTEAIIEGKDFPFSFAQLLKDIIRGHTIGFTKYALANGLYHIHFNTFVYTGCGLGYSANCINCGVLLFRL